MPFQLHGFAMAEFDGLADVARQISYGDLVSRVGQLLTTKPDARCVTCGLGFESHDWVDMSKLCSHYTRDAMLDANETRDVSCSPPFPVRDGQ